MQAVGPKRWLEEQLHPTVQQDELPALAKQQVDTLAISQRSMSELVSDIVAKGKALNQIPDADLKRAAGQAYQQGTPRQASRHSVDPA